MSDTTPRRTAGTVLSVHRTSQGLVRYRWWPGRISVELLRLDEPAQMLALVPGTEPARRRGDRVPDIECVPVRRNRPTPEGTCVDNDQRVRTPVTRQRPGAR
jgi:hypothetical protein